MRVFSTDHKVIGLQYAFTSLAFLLLGFLLILLVRWQHAYPTTPLPIVGAIFGWVSEKVAGMLAGAGHGAHAKA